MRDRTPVLYALKEITLDRIPFQKAIEKSEQFYNLSKEDKHNLFIDVTGILRKQALLRLEIKTVFPQYDVNDDEALLLCIALFEMRKAKGEQEKKAILREIVETIKSRGMKFKDEDVKAILEQSDKTFHIPEEYKKDPFVYNSLLFNLPSWVIRQYFNRYGNEKTLELLKANLLSPSMFLSVNGRKNKIGAYKGDERFEIIPSVHENYPEIGSLLVKKNCRPSSIKEVIEGKLYAQDLSYAKALDNLPLMQYYKVLYLGGKTGTTSASLAIRLLDLEGSVVAPVEEGIHFARTKALLRRLGLTNVKPYKSSLKMVKTIEEFDSYDLTVITPTSTHLGQTRRRPDVQSLFSVDALNGITRKQKESLTEASYFPRVHGTLAYIVPSILKEEGEGLIQDFLSDQRNINRYSLVKEETILPLKEEGKDYACDGLYYAIMTRIK